MIARRWSKYAGRLPAAIARDSSGENNADQLVQVQVQIPSNPFPATEHCFTAGLDD